MTTPTAAREPASGFSAWIALALFFAVAIGGLFYVTWSPYYAKAFIAAQDHTLGASILSGNAAAPPGVSWQAGLAYSFAYLKSIWQALLLGLAVAAGIKAWLPRATFGRLFAGSKGSLPATAFAIPSMMCTCCCAPIAVGMIESGAGSIGLAIRSSTPPPWCSSASSSAGNGRRYDWSSVWRSSSSSATWPHALFQLAGVRPARRSNPTITIPSFSRGAALSSVSPSG